MVKNYAEFQLTPAENYDGGLFRLARFEVDCNTNGGENRRDLRSS